MKIASIKITSVPSSRDCLFFVMEILNWKDGILILKSSWGPTQNKDSLTSIGIPIIKIRRSHDPLIFLMEILIPGKTVFILNLHCCRGNFGCCRGNFGYCRGNILGAKPTIFLSQFNFDGKLVCCLYGQSGGYFTNILRTLQDNLVKIYNARNHIYGENFKLKLCTCAQSHAHTYKVSAWNPHQSTISATHKFRENILESSRNVSETPPRTCNDSCCVMCKICLI